MLTIGRVAFLCLTTVFCVGISQFPLGLALPLASSPSFAAKDIHGTIWSATIAQLRIGDLELGKATVKMNPLHLVSGKPATSFAWQSKSTAGEASLRMKKDVLELTGLNARFAVSGGAIPGLADVADARVTLSGKQCVKAEGAVTFKPVDSAREYDGQLVCASTDLAVKMQVEGAPVTVAVSGTL